MAGEIRYKVPGLGGCCCEHSQAVGVELAEEETIMWPSGSSPTPPAVGTLGLHWLNQEQIPAREHVWRKTLQGLALPS